MDSDRYKRLQSNLNKEETRLKSLTANMDPFRLVELKSINEFREQNKDKSQTYEGDLEADPLGFLAKVQKAAKYKWESPSMFARGFLFTHGDSIF
jgi:uncharacterized protein (DUF342 family)